MKKYKNFYGSSCIVGDEEGIIGICLDRRLWANESLHSGEQFHGFGYDLQIEDDVVKDLDMISNKFCLQYMSVIENIIPVTPREEIILKRVYYSLKNRVEFWKGKSVI